ncbi:MAG: hypothetical protein JXB30_03725 [Anaerolineae bacterium]|nr:hypothetical protein [Anaerolineae bacterium]
MAKSPNPQSQTIEGRSPNPHVFGVRHHGPGSARSLRLALEELQPDIVLVEGPPEGEAVLPLVIHAGMKPPVALLVYQPDKPSRAAFYPFAVFSPEWQAVSYALENDILVRFMDLAQAHMMAIDDAEAERRAAELEAQMAAAEEALEEMAKQAAAEEETSKQADPAAEASPETPDEEQELSPDNILYSDPLTWLAKAAGFEDGEAWWERLVEQRQDSTDLFQGILEAMTVLREEIEEERPLATNYEPQREASMRKAIRTAKREGFRRIAVVCGAWHAPVLADMPNTAKQDNELLKGLPKVKVEATWAPWTYSRLTWASGYGAGITSPGWYEHLWRFPDEAAAQWLIYAARLLRGEDFTASTAQVIDALRLADALSALRGHTSPGLPELHEAVRATLVGGSDVPMAIIERKLIVGEVMGEVPPDAPLVPLQRDLIAQQKRLRMPANDTDKEYDLDLRKPNDLARSHLLHRLSLLDIPWGRQGRAGRAKGTFHEVWRLQWQPDFAVGVIEAAMWGNTVEAAATARTIDRAQKADSLPNLTGMVNPVLLADLPEASMVVVRQLDEVAALTTDTTLLMDALPPLANTLRYGNVRQTDASMVSGVVDGLIARICIGLPGACSSLNDDAAADMFKRLLSTDGAITLLQNVVHIDSWHDTLAKLVDQDGLNGLIAGRCCRILLDTGELDTPEAARRMGLALSPATDPAQAGAWLDGFLRGSGMILLHDDNLWRVLDDWVMGLAGDVFQSLLPLLRRTFSSFPTGERYQLGERVRHGAQMIVGAAAPEDFDVERAETAMPLVAQLLGMKLP